MYERPVMRAMEGVVVHKRLDLTKPSSFLEKGMIRMLVHLHCNDDEGSKRDRKG